MNNRTIFGLLCVGFGMNTTAFISAMIIGSLFGAILAIIGLLFAVFGILFIQGIIKFSNVSTPTDSLPDNREN